MAWLNFFISVALSSATVTAYKYDANGCLEGWKEIDDYCMGFFDGKMKFAAAERVCVEDFYADLASIVSRREWDFLTANVGQKTSSVVTTASPGTRYLWIGRRNGFSPLRNETVWVWTDHAKISYIEWRSENDTALLNTTSECAAAALDVDTLKVVATFCQSEMDGYVCKKARLGGFVITHGEGGRMTPFLHPFDIATTVREYSFYKVSNVSFLGLLAHGDDATYIGTEEELHLCADRCVSLSTCVFFDVRCETFLKMCDSLFCNFYYLL